MFICYLKKYHNTIDYQLRSVSNDPKLHISKLVLSMRIIRYELWWYLHIAYVMVCKQFCRRFNEGNSCHLILTS